MADNIFENWNVGNRVEYSSDAISIRKAAAMPQVAGVAAFDAAWITPDGFPLLASWAFNREAGTTDMQSAGGLITTTKSTVKATVEIVTQELHTSILNGVVELEDGLYYVLMELNNVPNSEGIVYLVTLLRFANSASITGKGNPDTNFSASIVNPTEDTTIVLAPTTATDGMIPTVDNFEGDFVTTPPTVVIPKKQGWVVLSVDAK